MAYQAQMSEDYNNLVNVWSAQYNANPARYGNIGLQAFLAKFHPNITPSGNPIGLPPSSNPTPNPNTQKTGNIDLTPGAYAPGTVGALTQAAYRYTTTGSRDISPNSAAGLAQTQQNNEVRDQALARRQSLLSQVVARRNNTLLTDNEDTLGTPLPSLTSGRKSLLGQ